MAPRRAPVRPPDASFDQMDVTELRAFAQESANLIAAAAATKANEESTAISRDPEKMRSSKLLASLAAHLLLVSFDDEAGAGTNGGSRRVEKFLEGAELLCTWPDAIPYFHGTDIPTRFPMLHALRTSASRPRRSPEFSDKLGNSLKAFVCGSERRVERYYSFLEGFASVKDQSRVQAEEAQADHATTPMRDISSPDDYPAHVHKTFYKIMENYSRCCCGGLLAPPRQHEGRLRLRERTRINDNDVVFDTVFSRAPNRHPEAVEWQHVQFHICLKRPGLGRVKLGQDPADATPDAQCTNTIGSANQFCGVLKKRIGRAKICLRVRDDGLAQLPLESVEDDIADEQSTSLASVLESRNLVAKERLLLAYVLATSFWQFYVSDWMKSRWTTETVQFFRERRGAGRDEFFQRLLTESPYITMSVHEADSLLAAEYLRPALVLHRYPRLLSLGTILLEIGHKKSRGKRNGCAGGEAGGFEEVINNSFQDIHVTTDARTEGWPDFGLQEEVHQKYKLIVRNCADPRLFAADTRNTLTGSNEQQTIEERRAIIYRRIVHPLKDLLEKLGWINKEGVIQNEYARGKAQSNNGHDYDTPSGAPAAFLNHELPVRESTQPGLKAERWLQTIQQSQVTRSLFTGFSKTRRERVRIAVLDTGYDPESTFFQSPDRYRRVQRWHDYTERNSAAPQDVDGHGTYVLSLLMKVAPMADFYVARVARDTRDLAGSITNVAKAITWASQDHEANLVCMSFGFEEDSCVEGMPVISNAMSDALQARNQRIIFFAAAANEGGNQAEMFPASHPQVISVRGTDDKGWSQPFNPPRGNENSRCIMTLGLDVPAAGLSRDGGGEVLKSGTSVSTPIAAGIAAMALAYARLYEADLESVLGPQTKRVAANVWTVAGIYRLLMEMSIEMIDRLYYLSATKFTTRSHELRLGMIAQAASANMRRGC